MPTPPPQLTIEAACAVIGEAGFGAQPFGVGLELEWFVVDESGAPCTDTAAMRRAIEADGRLPRGSRVTFEPGGQIEISTPPETEGPAALEAADADALAARTRLAAHGWSCVAVGLDATGSRPRVLDEPRYRAMAEYFEGDGCAGATMMRNTASLQVNVGYTDDLDAQWDYAHDLAPVLAAAFANSPFIDGRPSGWQSTRLATWAALDPARTRPVANGRPGARNAWLQYALDAPVMLVHDGDDCTVPQPSMTLREWIETGNPAGGPTPDDVAYHLTTLFPPIRPRGWLELRMLDALPEPWWSVAAAVTMTALTDPDTRAFLTPVLDGARDRWLDAAWKGVHDAAIADLARAVFAATNPALMRAGFGPDLVERVEGFRACYLDRDRSPADDLLDGWSATGSVAPAPEPLPAPTR
ncbi:MAG: glutamate-cysteine ligase family protein [Acidimicrobiia bacterium]